MSIKITPADREAAWRHAPINYGPNDKKAWMDGRYDNHVGIILAFTAHRLSALDPAKLAPEVIDAMQAAYVKKHKEWSSGIFVTTHLDCLRDAAHAMLAALAEDGE